MFDALREIACFVTGFISFLYATRIAWESGKKCQFTETPEHRARILLRSIPVTILIYFFGFLVGYDYIFDGAVIWLVASITSAIVLAVVVVSMAMPDLKRMPDEMRAVVAKRQVQVELMDGVYCQMDKKSLNAALDAGKVARFKRISGWVVVGADRMRCDSSKTFHAGVERREKV